MTPEELYAILKDILQPDYSHLFHVDRRKDFMSISSLVSGTRSYLYHWQQAPESNKKLNLALLRGSAIHAYINERFNQFDRHEIKWVIPYEWKDGTKNITLIGHWDNHLPNYPYVLLENKSTSQMDIHKNGLVLRAERQLGTYARILELKDGIERECFIVVANEIDLHIQKLSREQIAGGFNFVVLTALEVAKELDK